MWIDDWFSDFFGNAGFGKGKPSPNSRARRVISVTPSQIEDLLDWNDDPIGRPFGKPHHLVYARMIPFLAAAAQKVSGGKAQGKKTPLESYLPLAKAQIDNAGLQATYLRSFVSRSMKSAEAFPPQQLFALAAAAGTWLRQISEDEEEMLQIASLIRSLAHGITSEGEALIAIFLGYRSTKQESASHTVPIHHAEEEDPEKQDLAVLGLVTGASNEQIRHAWHDMVKRNHPDANKGNEAYWEKRMIAIGDAYQRLRTRRGF